MYNNVAGKVYTGNMGTRNLINTGNLTAMSDNHFSSVVII